MLNSTVERAMRDEDCAARASRNFRRSEDAYFGALLEAQQNGEIGSDRDLRALARFLAGSIRGIRVSAKATGDYQTLKDIADIALSTLHL
jgi:TetR/AcrR family transcriptional repressor of nem operon